MLINAFLATLREKVGEGVKDFCERQGLTTVPDDEIGQSIGNFLARVVLPSALRQVMVKNPIALDLSELRNLANLKIPESMFDNQGFLKEKSVENFLKFLFLQDESVAQQLIQVLANRLQEGSCIDLRDFSLPEFFYGYDVKHNRRVAIYPPDICFFMSKSYADIAKELLELLQVDGKIDPSKLYTVLQPIQSMYRILGNSDDLKFYGDREVIVKDRLLTTNSFVSHVFTRFKEAMGLYQRDHYSSVSDVVKCLCGISRQGISSFALIAKALRLIHAVGVEGAARLQGSFYKWTRNFEARNQPRISTWLAIDGGNSSNGESQSGVEN